MSPIYPYIHKPIAGTPFDPNHEQVQGLVGWWLLDEGMGLNVRNLVAPTGDTDGQMTNFANPSTPSSGWNPGQFGSALAFDGTNDRVGIGTGLITELLFTITAWIKPFRDGISGFGNGIFYEGTGSNDLGTGFLVVETGGGVVNGLNFFYDGGAQLVSPSNVITLNIWQHVAAVFNNGVGTILVNGEIVAGPTGGLGTGAPNGSNDHLGFWYASGVSNRYFQGVMDDVRLYKTALDQPLIERIVNDGYPQFKRRVFFDVAAAVGFAGALVNAPRLRSTVGGGLV